MVEYSEDMEIAHFDGYRFIRDDSTGYYLSSCKIGSRRKRLHVYVWEKFNGPIPKGYQVHHREFDKSKNEPEDLQLLTEHKHLCLHAARQTEEHKSKFNKAGIKAAPAWHRSQSGHEWHKEHYEQMKDKLYAEHDFVCANCGKPFRSTNTESRFCSNACKSAWRRKSGVDNEIRTCTVCGKSFIVGKYSKQECCSRECSAKLRWNKINQARREGGCLQHAS